jgi:type IV pilus assembly protein PilY1
MDITDPLNPELLWEFSHANLGFTTSYPAIAHVDGTSWVIAVGSGPTNLNGTSGQTGQVFFLDLATGTQITGSPLSTGAAATFMANPTFVDVDMLAVRTVDTVTYTPDRGYIGASNGKMYRLKDIDTAPALSTLIDLGSTKPITAAPSVGADDNGRLWVYFGTGKLLVDADQTNTDVQSLVGVKEPYDFATSTLTNATVSSANLLNTSNYTMFYGGYVDTDQDFLNGYETTFAQVETDIEQGVSDTQYDGWISNMTAAERVVTKPTILGGLVTFSTYLPDVADICQHEGDSYLNALYYKTGTAYWNDVLGVDNSTTIDVSGVTKPKINWRVKIGYGVASAPSLHVGKRTGAKVIIQTSTGEIVELDESNLPEAYKSRPLHWLQVGD